MRRARIQPRRDTGGVEIAERAADRLVGPTGQVVDLVGPLLTHHARRRGREARTGPWPDWVDPVVRDRLAQAGIGALWRHQGVAADAVWRGEDLVVATGTASGKSLAYLLPALTWARAPDRQRGTGTLYLAPTKALAADQARSIERLGVPDVGAGAVDGDATSAERDWARRHAQVVLTNPDMLHRSMLPGHRRWSELLGRLRLVVVDEAHHYRGLFGSHVAWVLRRLMRLAEHHGSRPQVLMLSATMAEPAALMQRLTGRAATVVQRDDSPAGEVDVLLVDTGSDPQRAGQHAWSSRLLARLVGADAQTIAFLRSRRGTEAVAAQAERLLVQSGRAGRVAAYRGGYLPEERRALEHRLRTGDLAGVAATNALELGVDITGMDAVVLGGWPGTLSAFWQRAGRAGRDGRGALVVFLAGADPLEQYVARHPEVVVGAPLERTVLDPGNPAVVAPHVCAAAAELPLRPDEVTALPAAGPVVDDLTRAGRLRRRPDGWYWPRRERPSDTTDIRGGGGRNVRLVEQGTGRLLGTVDAARAPATVHPGAVYVHQGAVFTVSDLDVDEAVALLVASAPEYETHARTVSQVRIVSEHEARTWGQARLAVGTVDVASRVVAYQKRQWDTGRLLGEVGLDLPERRLQTSACWWTLTDEAVAATGLRRRQVAGAVHAAEHASIGLLPLFATCDRWDVGGASTALHPDTGRLTVLVHDAAEGGAGFAARGYEAAQAWLTATRDMVAECRCADGCPSCVQSPSCGSGNAALDKAGAVTILSALLASAPDPPTPRG